LVAHRILSFRWFATAHDLKPMRVQNKTARLLYRAAPLFRDWTSNKTSIVTPLPYPYGGCVGVAPMCRRCTTRVLIRDR